MSTAIATPSVAEQEKALNQVVLEGRILDAIDQFYAEDVVMQENNAAGTVGKPANREREIQFLDSIEQFHGAQLLGSATHGDRSYSEWVLDITFKGGIRVKMEQVAARRWRNGQIVHERFYYNASNA